MPSLPSSYTVLARVVPIAAVAVPPVFLLGAGILSSARFGFAVGAVMLVASALAGQLGRDRGKKLEPGLWKSWGGAPTLRRLLYLDSEDPEAVTRLHQRIERVLGDPLPSQEEEAADRDAADRRYWEATRRLITIVGADHDRFHLVYAENVNYGMRRNLLGMKPIGIWVACLTGLLALALLLFAAGTLHQRAARYAPGLGASLLAVSFWAAIVSPEWVRVPGEEYATRLMESVELLLIDRAASSSS